MKGTRREEDRGYIGERAKGEPREGFCVQECWEEVRRCIRERAQGEKEHQGGT